MSAAKQARVAELLMAAAYKSHYADAAKILKFLAEAVAKKKNIPFKFHPGRPSKILREAKSQLKGGVREIVDLVESMMDTGGE